MGSEASDIFSPINVGKVDSNSFSNFSESNILSNCQDSADDSNSQVIVGYLTFNLEIVISGNRTMRDLNADLIFSELGESGCWWWKLAALRVHN